MVALRTPDDRFAALPDWPYEPRYTDIDGLRIHHVDVGPAGEAILCLHGEPSWGYLYRKMIPVFVAHGYRAIVPDLVGFGRSDKPADRSDYTYQRHVDWITRWMGANDLSGLTLVGQDWGGLIGLRVLAENPDRFRRAVVANTFLPVGDRPPSEAFLRWQRYSQESPRFHIGGIVSGGCVNRPLPDAVIAAYDAPFPDESYMAGARQFPALVPTSPDDPAAPANRAAWDVLERWDKPMLTAFSDSDAITAGGDRVFQARVPGCRGQAHTTITGAGHFLQEDQGPALAEAICAFIAANPA